MGLLHAPLPMGSEPLELAIEPGTPPRTIARDIERAGVRVDARLLFAWFRLSGKVREIRAATTRFRQHHAHRTAFDKLVRGEESLPDLTLVEGWTFRHVPRWREELRHDTASCSTPRSAAAAAPQCAPRDASSPIPTPTPRVQRSGRAAPCALHTMDAIWKPPGAAAVPTRRSRAPMRHRPGQHCRKGTGWAADRPQNRQVFANRLRTGMLPQTTDRDLAAWARSSTATCAR